MIDTPEITRSDAQLIASIPLTVPREEICNVMGPGIQEVYATLAAQGITPAGPWLTHHLRRPTETFDFEICVPVATPVTPTGRVQAGELRATRVVQTVYQGAYEGLAAAWGEFMAWIEGQGLPAAEDLWEIYVAGPETSENPVDWRTILVRPLEG